MIRLFLIFFLLVSCAALHAGHNSYSHELSSPPYKSTSQHLVKIHHYHRTLVEVKRKKRKRCFWTGCPSF